MPEVLLGTCEFGAKYEESMWETHREIFLSPDGSLWLLTKLSLIVCFDCSRICVVFGGSLELKEFCLTFGRFHFVAVSEGPSDEAALKAIPIITSRLWCLAEHCLFT